MEQHLDLIATFGGIIASIGVFWGITWKMGTEIDKKIGRVYGRFDEYKNHLEDTHTRKEVCDIKHEQISNDLMEIKKDVKELLKKANGKS